MNQLILPVSSFISFHSNIVIYLAYQQIIFQEFDTTHYFDSFKTNKTVAIR